MYTRHSIIYRYGRREKSEKEKIEEIQENNRQRREYKKKLLSDLTMIQTKPHEHLNDQTRTVIINLYSYFRFEKAAKSPLISPKNVLKRLALATGIPKWSLVRTVSTKVKPERKKRKTQKTEPLLTDREIIRDTIHQFYRENRPITLRKLKAELHNTVALDFSVTSLWKVLIKLGFRYKSRRSRLFVYQRPEIMAKRNDYIIKMRRYRRQNRPIFYQDETWLNAGHIPVKAWVDTMIEENPYDALSSNNNLTLGYNDPIGKGKRLIISHIGGEDGFLESGQDIFESKKTDDYHLEMNSERYEYHMENKVFPNLPENSVVVIDNAPYHSRVLEKIPCTTTKKGEILQWLKNKNIAHDESQTKKRLLSVVRNYRMQYPKKYYLEEQAKKFGVEILRLPPYHCELNPIELIWGQIKSNVAKRNTTFKLADVRDLLKEEIANIDKEAWKKAINHVKKIEEKYGKRVFEPIPVKPLIIELDFSDEESDDSEELDFSSDDSYEEEL